MSGLIGGVALRAAIAIAAVGVAVAAVQAQEITLRMKGGDFQVTGELRAYDREKYTIFSNALGAMSLDASRFECIGDNCPDAPVTAPVSPAALISGTSGQLRIVGSNTVGNQLMPALIQSFATRNEMTTTKVVGTNPLDVTFKLVNAAGRDVAEIELARHGSTTSFAALLDGSAEIGMSSRPVKDKEAAALAAAGRGDMRAPSNEHIIGLDGLLVIVSEDNPAVSLSLEQVAKIFSGAITDWSEIGLPGGPINVYAPSDDSGTYDTFESLVLRPTNAKLAAAAKRTENHAEQSDWVARDPQGIGVVGIAYQRNAKPLNIARSCGLIAKPTRFAMKTEEYPLTRRLYLYTPGRPKDALARGLLDYALSKEAQPVVTAADFIDQSPEALPFVEQSARIAYALNASEEDFDMDLMRSLISTFKGAERMSVTLRFRPGAANLDNKALSDIARLRDTLAREDYAGKTVLIAGYADAVGAFPVNLDLSQKRAHAVLAALMEGDKAKLDGLKFATYAFSELAPVACNDEEAGRSFNRRVEVWVRD